jgi:DNA-binding beta-propeller fold protein YncE
MMKTRKLLQTALVALITLSFLVACGAPASTAPTETSPPSTSPPASEPTATEAPAPSPVPTEAPSPVKLALEIRGDPDPLYWPSGLAFDGQGNLFVADTRNHRILKFDSSGQLLTSWGEEGSGDGQFNFFWGDPNHNLPGAGLAVDSQGNLYVTDMGNVRIQKFDKNGRFLAKWGSQGTGDGQFTRPLDLAVDTQGNVYVIDDRSDPKGRIQKFDSSCKFLARFGEGLFADPGLITVDGLGNIYVPDFALGTILKLNNQGELLATWGSSGTGEGQFRGPSGIEVDGQGNIYVVDSGNGRIQKLDRDGNFLLQWGSKGSGDGQFREPYGIRVASDSSIYVSDYLNNRIQKLKPAAATTGTPESP